MKKIMLVIGTRPEAIKLAPVILALKREKRSFKVKVVATAQHRQLLTTALSIFDIAADYDIDVMRPNQELVRLSARVLKGLEDVIKVESPDAVVIQGDTTSAFIAALTAYYNKIPIAHVEAGLRTYHKYNPFPEEINRHLISVVSDINFAPTIKAKRNLLSEGVPQKNIWVTGNTIVDALFYIINRKKGFKNRYLRNFNFYGRRAILVTAHRRESFGEPLKNICEALKRIVGENSDVEIFYPVHPNPNVRSTAYSMLKKTKSMHLLEPLSYPDFINLMARSCLILTDSGGVQEEAPSLGKRVLVMRQETERPELIEAGLGIVVGTDAVKIAKEASHILKKTTIETALKPNPFGDGKSSQRILKILIKKLAGRQRR